MKKGSRLLVLPLACSIALTTVHAQKIALKKGQKLETVATTKMTMEVMGQNVDNQSTATSSVVLKDITDSGYIFSNTLNRMTVKGNGMGQDVSFDSDKKEDMDGQMGQVLKDKIGAEQEIKVDKSGKVSGIAERDSSKAAGGGMADMMSMTGALAKGQPYPVLIQLPSKNIKPGDTWTDSSGTPATVKTVMVYTLKSLSGDSALVTFTGTIAKNGTLQQNGMEIQMDMTGTTKGQSSYESSTGLLKRSSSTSDISGSLGVMGQNAPISATVNAEMVARKL